MFGRGYWIFGKQIKQLNQKYFDNYMKKKPCDVWGKVLDCWEACYGSFLADFLEAGNYPSRPLQNIFLLCYENEQIQTYC